MPLNTIELRTLLSSVQSGDIVLPNFQREFRYERDGQRQLICSLLSDIPIGAIMVLNGASEVFDSRKIGRKPNISYQPTQGKTQYLLDGQQRLTTLWSVLTDIYAGLDMTDRNTLYSEISPKIRTRWFIRLRPIEREHEDVLGFDYFDVNSEELRRLEPDHFEPLIGYSRGVKKGTTWMWGKDLKFEEENKENKDLLAFCQKEQAIPLAFLSDSDSFSAMLLQLSTKRKYELAKQIELILTKKAIFSELSSEDRLLLTRAIGVDDEVKRQEFASRDNMAEKLATKLELKRTQWQQTVGNFLLKCMTRHVMTIDLDESALGKAHAIFDVINKTGIRLSTFDLFCAGFPGYDVRGEVYKNLPDEFGFKDNESPSSAFTDYLLNLLRIVHADMAGNMNESTSAMKSQEIFKMDPAVLKVVLPRAISAIVEAGRFLKDRCGVAQLSRVAYKLQFLPIAYAHFKGVHLKADLDLLEYMYWVGLFGGRYRSGQNAVCAYDVNLIYEMSMDAELDDSEGSAILEFKNFKDKEQLPNGLHYNRIFNFEGYNDEATLLPAEGEQELPETPPASMYTAIHQFILSRKPADFLPDDKLHRLVISDDDLQIDKHHLIPLASNQRAFEIKSKELRENKQFFLNSPLNMTPISNKANLSIGNLSPDKYVALLNDENMRHHFLPTIKEFTTHEDERQWLLSRFTKLREGVKNHLDSLIGPLSI